MENLTILDGGMGGELLRRGLGGSDGLWSAQALIDHPDVVTGVHRDYIDAGARIIITNTYSTIPSYLGKADQAGRYLELAAIAGQIARKVADDSESEVLVAGSLPPLNESYRFDLVPPEEEATPIYEELAKALRPYVDMFLCETMSSAKEARNAVSAARRIAGDDMPVWVSWTLAEEPGKGVRSGDSIKTAFHAIAEFSPDAFLFNCTAPDAISAGLKELRKLTDKPIGAYPNVFHVPEGWTLDNEINVEPREMTEAEYLNYAEDWQRSGATLIGGCCGVGPEFIRALSASVST